MRVYLFYGHWTDRAQSYTDHGTHNRSEYYTSGPMSENLVFFRGIDSRGSHSNSRGIFLGM